MLPSQLIVFFKPHAFAYWGCGNPLSQEVFAATKSPLSSLRHIHIPYRPYSWKIVALMLHFKFPAIGICHRSKPEVESSLNALS
jgi:hypothetical protein